MIAPASIFVCRGILFFDFIFFARFSRGYIIYIASKNDNFIYKTKLDIGEFFDQPSEEVSVTLKEPSTLQYLKIQEAWKTQDESKIITDFYEIFADLIIDHSLYHTESKKMSNKEATDLLFGKFEAITYIMQKYYEFLGESKKKSQKKSQK